MSAENVMPDTSELYYAHMEADRNEAEKAYFDARPQLVDCSHELVYRQLFRAGFERAYQKLWPAVIRGGIAK